MHHQSYNNTLVNIMKPEKKQRQKEEMLRADKIQPPNSEWPSSVILVKKSNGQFRFCVNYRQLNKYMQPINYLLPSLTSCLTHLVNLTLAIKNARM